MSAAGKCSKLSEETVDFSGECYGFIFPFRAIDLQQLSQSLKKYLNFDFYSYESVDVMWSYPPFKD